ncbi:MAG: signal peptidase I [Acidimicrobiales bacterium]|nr:signal peptidase I [Actinomycetota bacterium]
MPDAPQQPPQDPSDGLARRARRDAEATARTVGGPPEPGDVDAEPTAEELAQARRDRQAATAKAQKSPTRNVVEWIGVIAGAVLIAVVVRTFVFQTFWIPSPSMATTLVKDDRVLVNKLSYRLHDPRRGDVIVFERPPNEQGDIKDLIKRVIGLPGERISIIDGEVRIDGRVLDEPYTHGLPTEPKVGCGLGDTTGIDTEQGFEIPPDHLFVMGDNRTNSQDGRCFGPIDEDLVVGRAFFIIWPLSKTGGL